MLRPLALSLSLSACALASPASQEVPAAVAAEPLTMKRIMADPDWIGRGPEAPYWADDSGSILYQRKREGEQLRDLYRLDLATGEERVVTDAERAALDSDGGDHDRARSHKVFARHGDLFVKHLTTGEVSQLTRTVERESSPSFMVNEDRIQFTRGGNLFVRERSTGLELQPADLRFEDDPDEKKEKEKEDEEKDYLEEQQERLFDIVKDREERSDRARERDRELHGADPTRAPLPWYLGAKKRKVGEHLSPNGHWLLVRVAPESKSSKRDEMPEYVTASSWVETREVRAHVGQANRTAEDLVLLDLEHRERFDLDLSVLPQLTEDPLAWLDEMEEEEEPDESDDEEEEKKPEPRDLSIRSARWSPDGTQLVFMGRTLDNKDRYIARVDLETKEIVPLHNLRDEAWINWSFNDYGWLDDSSGVWFLSEETGYSQLYLWSRETGAVRALTEGEFEVSSVTAFENRLVFRANVDHPGIHDVCAYDLPDGPLEKLTALEGSTTFILSPDGEQLLLTHSKKLAPPELYVQAARSDAEPRKLTATTSEAFRSIEWVEPDVVEIPSRHGGAPIYGRLYTPEVTVSSLRPAVIFVHGAGYTQNAHHGWSRYFREFMFHSMLVQEGYVVLDLDYRASAGYGRDWRTSIYRQMGTPELEDHEDAIDWLANQHSVDPERVGMYGGSYGGFLTLMTLFKRPELLACGAALRPVTDWAHYNHSYTSNILNTPERDPKAFEASSPIEYAEGLERPLLICHGMLDDNVLVKDSIRLAQRLIELEKEDWELALFPIEPHGFREPSSWLDEYRRIFKLFETHLK